MEDKSQLIGEIREKFFKRLEDEGLQPESKFHPADITRVKTGDDWLRRFLEHNDFHVQEALDMLWDTCEWRKKFGTNEITEDNVRKDYLADGVCFPFGKDKDGKKLFVIKSKLHIKGAKEFAELQRCIVYWFERLEREGNDQITLFFDMAEAGLSNLDMEFTKYLISLFKCYYPNFLNYIIILEMPWVLNAAFKIIKSWLPAKAIPKIKSVNKSTLKEWVEPADSLKCWGGENDYTFNFSAESDNAVNGKLMNNRKVHFNEESPTLEQSNINIGDKEKMISIDPEVLVFNRHGEEISCTFTLKNVTQDKPLSYKLKTTSPEKFRVRPSNGILLPAQQCTVKVVLQSGYHLRGFLHNDRFLLMCIPLSDTTLTNSELADLWRQTEEESIEQHRLLCRESKNENGDVSKTHGLLSAQDNKRTIDGLFNKVAHIQDCCDKIHNQVTTVKHLLIIFIIFTIGITIVAAYLIRIDLKYSMEDQHCRLRNE